MPANSVVQDYFFLLRLIQLSLTDFIKVDISVGVSKFERKWWTRTIPDSFRIL